MSRFACLLVLASACSFVGASPVSTDADGGQNDAAIVDSVTETCGNGALDADESCDDGARVAGDGCDVTCQIEPGFECDLGTNCVEIDDLDWTQPQETTEQLGNSNGGSGFTELCDSDEIGVGFTGIEGTVCGGSGTGVARLRMVCADIDFDEVGGAVVADSEETEQQGECSPAGSVTSGSIRCPDGSVLSGVRGLSNGSGYLTKLEGVCQPLTLVGGELALGAPGLATGSIGSGTIDDFVNCDAGEVVVGFSGREGQVIDQLHLQCAAVGTAPPN